MRKDIDAKGLRCPRPIIEVAKAKRELSGGDEICIVADDPAFEADINAWCESTGCEISECRVDGGVVKATIVIK